MGVPLMMLCVLLILETPCPGVGMLPRELSIDPDPQDRLREMMTFIVRMEVVCLKLRISVHGDTKNCPFGGKYKITKKFCYFEKTLDTLNKSDWKPNLRTYYKTWER